MNTSTIETKDLKQLTSDLVEFLKDFDKAKKEILIQLTAGNPLSGFGLLQEQIQTLRGFDNRIEAIIGYMNHG